MTCLSQCQRFYFTNMCTRLSTLKFMYFVILIKDFTIRIFGKILARVFNSTISVFERITRQYSTWIVK